MSDFYKIGVVCKIIRYDQSNSNPATYKLLVQGIRRIELSNINVKRNTLIGTYKELEEIYFDIETNKENKSLILKNVIESSAQK